MPKKNNRKTKKQLLEEMIDATYNDIIVKEIAKEYYEKFDTDEMKKKVGAAEFEIAELHQKVKFFIEAHKKVCASSV